MSRAPVARRYAQALLEIGIERGNFDQMREQLNALATLFADSRDFRNTMLNPSIALDERKVLMKTIAERVKLDPMVRNFTLLLLDNERFRFVQDIAQDYQELADRKAGRVRAAVTSAVKLDSTQINSIKAQLMKLTGASSIELDADVDESLIGGVVTRVGGIVLDGSVRNQLDAMRASILEEL